MEEVRYGAGGKIMVNQPRKVEPVEKTAKVKKEKKQPLQEIYGDSEKDGFDEELEGEDNELLNHLTNMLRLRQLTTLLMMMDILKIYLMTL